MKDDFHLLAKIYNLIIKPKKDIAWINYICDSQNNLVLDVGGGTGRIADAINQQNCKVIIYDPSMHMLNMVQNKDHQIYKICGEVEQIAFCENQFDNVIMVDTLHHVRNQQKAIDSIFYILKPGGTFILEEPDIRKFAVKLIAILEKVLLMRSHFLKPSEILNLFPTEQSSIKIIEDGANVYFIVNKK
jgi:ubiquinone/menaquinone biosynthesis C-methylase UbiE